MQSHRLAHLWAYTAGRLFSADFLQKAAEQLCRNFVSSRIRIWARIGDAGRTGEAISYAASLAGFLPSQSVAFSSDPGYWGVKFQLNSASDEVAGELESDPHFYFEKYFARYDMTEEFPFLVAKMSPYYDR